jgi:hypothetical protein
MSKMYINMEMRLQMSSNFNQSLNLKPWFFMVQCIESRYECIEQECNGGQ